jgi:Wax ester synthase/diacylglycerol acyltransferase catalytic domain
MAYSFYERLSALDRSFLDLEDHNAHMHIGAVAVFDGAPVRDAHGGVDMDRIRGLVEGDLHRIPRYRQRLAWTPVSQHPVWVDDARFNLAYHIRHTHLPKPGDARLLKRLAARIMSQQLDRGKPLWEMWVVDGLEGDCFAIITKVHHCMIDGVGSVELTGSLMRAAPHEPAHDRTPPRWLPRPEPSPRALLAGELRRRVEAPLAAFGALGHAVTNPLAAVTSATEALGSLREDVHAALHRVRAAGGALAAVQPDRDERSRPAVPGLCPRRADAFLLPARPPLPESGARGRALQLRWSTVLGLQRRLGRDPRPARSDRGGRARIRGTPRGRGGRGGGGPGVGSGLRATRWRGMRPAASSCISSRGP